MRISDWSSDVCSSDLIAQAYQTTLTRRGGRITLRGGRAEQAAHALGWFHQHSADGPLALEDIQLGLVELGASGGPSMAPPELPPVDDGSLNLRTRKTDLRPRTPRQRDYLNALLKHDVPFGVGPAGQSEQRRVGEGRAGTGR